jgi:hypothetical protein
MECMGSPGSAPTRREGPQATALGIGQIVVARSLVSVRTVATREHHSVPLLSMGNGNDPPQSINPFAASQRACGEAGPTA